jgi:hypothetical protein
MRRAALAIAASAALLPAGCGGGGGSTPSFTGPDPATLVPADAPLFAEAVVRPQGDQKEALDSALSKLLATDDPGGFIVSRLDRALAGEVQGFTYEQDVEPWLGPRAGIFFETFTDHADGAAVLSVTNPAAARAAVEKLSADSPKPERQASYRAVRYTVDRDGTATGLVADFLVTGSEPGFKDAVDASQGSALAASSDFRARLASEPDDQVAFAYANPRAVVQALEKSGQLSPGQVSSAAPQLQALLSQPATLSISAAADQLGLQASAATGSSTPAPQESPLLRDFPGDSWFAFAANDAGRAYGEALAQGGSAAVSQALGFNLGAQLRRWAGDLGGFVSGTSLFGLGGALVLSTNDEQASSQTLTDLQRALSTNGSVNVSPLSGDEQGFSLSPAGAPIEFRLVQQDGKVVVGLGSDSVDEVLSPTSTLGDSEAFQAATNALGNDVSPVAFVDFAPLLQLLDERPHGVRVCPIFARFGVDGGAERDHEFPRARGCRGGRTKATGCASSFETPAAGPWSGVGLLRMRLEG